MSAIRKRIIITYALPAEWFSSLSDEFDLVFPMGKSSFTQEELLGMVGEADAVLSMFSFNVNREIVEAGAKGRLKIISNFGVGFNNVDISAAKEYGIAVTNTPDPVIEPTAELAFALMGDLARNITLSDKKMRKPNGVRWGVMENIGTGLYGKTLGIVGLGRIGAAVAKRAIVAGMKVVYHNRNKRADDHLMGWSYVGMDELLSVSDFISIHVPLDETTHHLIDEHAFARMKKSAFVINTARGAVIDERALAKALHAGDIMGAGLDVYEFEPSVSEELLSTDRVVMVPHVGTATLLARQAMAKYASDNVSLFFGGKQPLSRIV